MRVVNHVRWIDEDAERTTEYFEVREETPFGWKVVGTFECQEAAEECAVESPRPLYRCDETAHYRCES